MSWLACCTLMVAESLANAQPLGALIIDNDFSGPGGSDIQSTIAAFNNPNVKLLGLTVVTGDDGMQLETAHLLRFLEISSHTKIPVYKGAEMPLINTPQRLSAWEALYGKLSWKGVWNDTTSSVKTNIGPSTVPLLKEGDPKIKAESEAAAEFLIEQAHRYPHQLTIVAAGPLTNLALATRLDPYFPKLVRQLVITNSPGSNLNLETGSVASRSDFNFLFDPEAARIVLTAPFSDIVSVGPVVDSVVMDDKLIADMSAVQSPLSAYLTQYAWKGLPMWDEIAVAITIDPTLITKSANVLMNIDLEPGASFGSAVAYREKSAPNAGERKVKLVLGFDQDRFRKEFLDALRRN